ncbi:MAG TPA: hypothetical protein VLG39_04190 [Nitrospirota bacterium]|nr:hypothetical protein [Nitrospirota bacterium]
MSLFIIAALIVLVLTGLVARSWGSRLKTEAADPAEVRGKFTLLLYGSDFPDNLVNVAILDKEGDPYSFQIHAPDFSCTTRTGMDGAQALQEAERFVRRHIRSEGSQLRRVLGPSGSGLGFELRPLYPVTAYGTDDILDVTYSIRDRKITIRIELDPAVERKSTN